MMHSSNSCPTFQTHISLLSKCTVENPKEIVSGLEQSNCDVSNQCHRMQLLSRCLKNGRSRSHPERDIGASDRRDNAESSRHIVTEDLLMRLCHRIPALASLATAQKPGNFFKFFFLSLLLDILKAFATTEVSADVNRTSVAQQNGHANFDDISVLVIQVLRNSDSDCDVRWLQSRTCCLKVTTVRIIRLCIGSIAT